MATQSDLKIVKAAFAITSERNIATTMLVLVFVHRTLKARSATAVLKIIMGLSRATAACRATVGWLLTALNAMIIAGSAHANLELVVVSVTGAYQDIGIMDMVRRDIFCVMPND